MNALDKADRELLVELVELWEESGKSLPIGNLAAWKDLIAAGLVDAEVKRSPRRVVATPTSVGIDYVHGHARGLRSRPVARPPSQPRRPARSPQQPHEIIEKLTAIAERTPAIVPRPKPKRHQTLAVAKAAAALEHTDRAQIVAPCGTGKTLISIMLAGTLRAETILVLVPRKSLVEQTIAAWYAWNRNIVTMTVYSDPGGTREQADVAAVLETVLPSGSSLLVVSTYHSSPIIAAAALSVSKKFDLVIYDEAHHASGAGSETSPFLLSAARDFPARKRLFMTATRRILRSEKGTSMDDEEIFGPVAWRISFRDAIRQGLIADYKIIALSIENEDVRNSIFASGKSGDEFSQFQIATHVALAKAIARFELAKLLTFHNRVRDARRFADPEFPGSFPQVRAALGLDEEIFAEHVSGDMNAALREQILDGIDTASVGFVANARCLTEGVDLPDLDAVAFMGSMRSRIDILQAVGRALRKPHDRKDKIAYIFVPLVVEEGEIDAEPLVDLLAALREEDEDLADCVVKFSDSSASSSSGSGSGGSSRSVDVVSARKLSAHVMRTITTSVDACKLETGSISWHERYEQLRSYVREHGELPTAKIGDIDWKSWLENQRSAYRRGVILRSRAKLLDALGIQWNPIDGKWQRGLAELVKFVETDEIMSMKSNYATPTGYPLNQWVRTQQRRNREGLLTADRIKRLEAVRGWKWERWSDLKWATRVAEATKFCKKKPGGTPLLGTFSATGIDLHEWFLLVRSYRRSGQISEEHKRDLDAIPGWSWS